MRNMKARALWLSAVVAVLVVAAFLPARALDQASKPITLSPEKRVSEQSFLPMASPDPVGLFSVSRCRTSVSCDTIPFVLDIPEKYIHLTIITLSFEHASAGAGTPGANDLDMFIYEEVKNESGATAYERLGSAASQAQPEVFKVADIPGTTARAGDDIAIAYWIVIVNFTGSSAYTLKGELRPQTVTEYKAKEGATPRPRQVDPTKASPSKPDFGSSLPQVAGPEAEKLPSVKEPGADGELSELPLVAIRGQAREEAAKNRTPLIIATIVLLAIAGGTFAFFYIRSRRATEEAAT